MARPNAGQEPSDLPAVRARINVPTIAWIWGLGTKKPRNAVWNSMHGVPSHRFAYEKIGRSVSVANVPNSAWYETDLSLGPLAWRSCG